MKNELLENAIEDRGIRPGFISDKLGISLQALSQKRNGRVPFTVKEIKILKELFGWNYNQVGKIFLEWENCSQNCVQNQEGNGNAKGISNKARQT